MTRLALDAHSPAQRRRLERYKTADCVDAHCHCLPGLDDGPASVSDAVELCRALVEDGVTTAIATPHQLGRFDGRVTAGAIRQGVADLNAVLIARGIPLSVVPGADVRVDERIPALLDTGQVLTLADSGKYLLLELPHDTFINIQPLLKEVTARQVTPILSHPERNVFLSRRPEVVIPWLEQGCMLQITAGSLTGSFGPAAERAAWHWLATGAASFVATDAHDAGARGPCMTQAIDAISRRQGEPAAYRVCMLNPARLLGDQPVRLDRRASHDGDLRWVGN